MSEIKLVYLGSKYIVDYITEHPIEWSDKELAKIGGLGDQCGIPPTSSVLEFLKLLTIKESLFTQQEYVDWCFKQWGDWLKDKLPENTEGLKAKLYRNFYPSMIDTLHAWSLLAESIKWDSCILDSYKDVFGKTDLTLQRGTIIVKIALLGPFAKHERDYKLNHRKGYSSDIIEIKMPICRTKKPGNKRWYQISDFEILNSIIQPYVEEKPTRKQLTFMDLL